MICSESTIDKVNGIGVDIAKEIIDNTVEKINP